MDDNYRDMLGALLILNVATFLSVIVFGCLILAAVA